VKKCGIFLLILALIVGGCGPGKKRSQKKMPKLETFNAPARGIKLQFDDPATGKPRWRLSIESGSVTFQQGSNRGFGQLRGLSGVLYEKGKPGIRVSADVCDYDTNKQVLRASGNVTGTSYVNGVSFRADKMYWQAKKDVITAEGQPVVISKSPGFELRDTKLIANTSLKVLHN
jgi:hypothetical protein